MIYINHIYEVNQTIPKEKYDYSITPLEKADIKVAFSTVNRLLTSTSAQLPDQLGQMGSHFVKHAYLFLLTKSTCAAVDSGLVTNFDLNHDTDLEQSTTTTLDYYK